MENQKIKNASLNIAQLTLRFPNCAESLFHINEWHVPAGQCIGICGASGAGKTSLFNCLAGIEKPSSGQIFWGDIDICQLKVRERDQFRHQQLGLVFQDFHLIEGLSALDNVLLPLSFSEFRIDPEKRARAHELLEKVAISAPYQRIDHFSRGERQRVALARALLLQPKIILADEPTASLDPLNREIIANLLIELVRAHSATLLLISHEANLLAQMDHCFELKNGDLISIGHTYV